MAVSPSQGEHYMAESDFYDRNRETMPYEKRRAYVNRRLRQVIRHAYEKAPAMRERMAAAGITPAQIRNLEDLQSIPIIKKDDLVELQMLYPPLGGLCTTDLRELKWVFISPGPIYEPIWPIKLGIKVFYNCGFRKGDIVLNPWSYHLTPGGLGIDTILRSLGATVIPAGVGNTELQVQAMHRLKVTGYTGSLSFLMTLIERAEDLSYDFRKDFSIRLAVVAGEMMPTSWKREVERKYGFDIREFYGTADTGISCYECRLKEGLHIPEEMIFEIVDTSTGRQLGPGEVGEIVITTLASKTYPLVRFGTGDLSSYIDEPCGCGRTSKRLTRILGRVGEAVRVRNMFVHPNQVRECTSAFPQIVRCQLVIGRSGYRDTTVMRLQCKDEPLDKARLEGGLKRQFTELCKVKIDQFEYVSASAIPEGTKTIIDERKWD